MFSKKSKAEKKENSVSTTGTHNVSQTSEKLTVQSTFQYRSRSVSHTCETHEGFTPSSIASSIVSLPGLNLGNNYLTAPNNLQRSSSSSTPNWAGVKMDAKPFNPSPAKVNLNYQSPYQNSPVYSSFRNKPSLTPIPKTAFTSVVRKPPETLLNKTDPNKKKLVVKKTGIFYDNSNRDNIPTYKTSSKDRGEVLIINNILFKGKDERKGAKVDHERLEDLFKQIGFRVGVKIDLKADKMKTEIKSFSQKSSLKTADISVVVVMSHGMKNNVQGGTEVFGVDEKGLLVEEIVGFFSGEQCKYMRGKPKIFIFQCCRGGNEQSVCTDAKPIRPRPLEDMLIAYSTLPGFVSYRSEQSGTWYIQTLCEVFSQHAHEYHIEELLKIVDMELSSLGDMYRQTSSYESRGFKRCYLHPK